MTNYVVLLRAVNVGGTGKLPMSDLKDICETAGLKNVRTYIASGNVVFESKLSESVIKTKLEKALATYANKPVGVVVRSADEMQAILAGNPFPEAAPNRTVAIFLDCAPPPSALADVRNQTVEEIALGTREIYVHYGAGMADSKLKIPAAKLGTARNMNTVAKLAQMVLQATAAVVVWTLLCSQPLSAKPTAIKTKPTITTTTTTTTTTAITKATAKVPVKAYVLTQNNTKSGPQKVTVSPTAMRVDLIKQGIVVFMGPAGKPVQILNAAKNVYYETDIDKYHSGQIQGGSFIRKCERNGINWHVTGTGIIGGAAADDNILGRDPDKDKDGGLYAEQPLDRARHHYWTARDIPVSVACAALLARMAGIVSINKVPLRLTLFEPKKGRVRTWLNTTECRTEQVQANIFAPPAGAKKVQTELEAVAGIERSELPGLGSLIFKTRAADLDADEEHLPPAPLPKPSRSR